MRTTQKRAVLKASVPDSSGDVFFTEDAQSVTTSTAPDIALNAQGGSGTNKVGGDLSLCGGKPTGNAAGGSVILRTASPGASGTAQRDLANRVELDTQGVLWLSTVNTAPTVGRAGKLGLFNDSGVLKVILPDNSVGLLVNDES